jgi:hypothetical protein
MLPIVLGALYASLTGSNLGALGLSLAVAIFIALAHRKSIITGVKTLKDYRRFVFDTNSVVNANDINVNRSMELKSSKVTEF